MRVCYWITLGILAGCVCFGQALSVGIIGGAMGTDDLTGAGAMGVSKRYVIGPALDIGLPLGFGAEANALYSATLAGTTPPSRDCTATVHRGNRRRTKWMC